MERHVNQPGVRASPLLRMLVAFAAGLTAAAVQSPAQSVVRETAIMIGDGWGIVKESRQIDLRSGEQDVDFEGIPPEADLSSLVLRSRRISLEVLAWERVETARGDAGAVRCRIRSPVAAQRVGVDLLYRVDGMEWSASYEIVVRGEGDDEAEAVSTDLRGVARLINRTAGAFSNAVIALSGADPGMQDPSAAASPGFLDLDRSNPLTDIWFDAPEGEAVAYSYEMPARVSLRPYSESDVPLVLRNRMPASRVYAMTAEDFPLNAREHRPLRKWIVFRHGEGVQQDAMLPPGDVRVLLGGNRRQFVQTARFRRTAPGEEVRVDLGPSDEMKGRRFSGTRETQPGGMVTESYVVELRNEGDTDFVVEVDEKPPAALGWRIISATHAHRLSGTRLQFKPTVRSGADETIEYRLSVPEPQI